jgi:acylphosphatase
VKGSFLIKAKEEDVITEKGARAFIMDRLLNSPFNNASVENIDNKTIQVRLEGDEKQIKEFIKNLEKDLIARFGNPTISFTQFQENPALEIPELMRSSQALMVGQLEKGINVQLEILSTLQGLGSLKVMPEELRQMSKEINALPEGLRGELSGIKKETSEVKNIQLEILSAIKELPKELGQILGK